MKKINNKSIFSLLLGSASILIPFTGYMYIGLILAIMGVVMAYKAVKEINNSGEKGKILAIVAMFISIVVICCELFIIFILVVFYLETTLR